MSEKLANSLIALARQGEAKKTDSFRVPLDKLEFEEGFNLREETPELDEHIESITKFILSGGQLPPLEVRVVDGRVLVVEGHCRTNAYRRARDRGADIQDVACVPFSGNDAARVVKMIASSQGKSLTPIETARGYARLIAFGRTPQEIADAVGKTRQHVEQLLILANANTDVQRLVSGGAVSASVAIKTVRDKGERAGELLQREIEKAAANGKRKVTAGTMQPKPLPASIVKTVVDALDEFEQSLPMKARTMIAAAGCVGSQAMSANVEINAFDLFRLMEAHHAIAQHRAKQSDKDRAKAEKLAQTELREAA